MTRLSFRLPETSANVRAALPVGVGGGGGGGVNANGSVAGGGELFEKFQRQKLNKENGHGSPLNDR